MIRGGCFAGILTAGKVAMRDSKACLSPSRTCKARYTCGQPQASTICAERACHAAGVPTWALDMPQAVRAPPHLVSRSLQAAPADWHLC